MYLLKVNGCNLETKFAVNLVTCLLALAYILCINPPTDSFVGVIPLIIAFFIIAGSALTSIITSFIGFAF